MRKAPFVFAGVMVAGFFSAASAQVMMPRAGMPSGIDCSTPENALEYYCNHRNEFDSSGAFIGTPPVAPMEANTQVTGSTARHHVARKVKHH